MTWAQRLKRVFNIDIETCPACGGAVRIIACIEDPEVIEKILTHLAAKGGAAEATRHPRACSTNTGNPVHETRGGETERRAR